MYSWRRRWVSAIAWFIVCLSSLLSIGVFLGLHRRHQGALLLAREHVYLGDLRLGDLVGINAGDADAVVVHVQHDGRGLGLPLVEHGLQQSDDEFHGGEVVVVEQDAVHPWTLGLALAAALERNAALRTGFLTA